MDEIISGFDWDQANRQKCQKHGVSIAEIERLFDLPLPIRPDIKHSVTEQRLNAIGKSITGRSIFLAFTLRKRDGKTFIRPISARYMHKNEVRHYEEENPNL